LKEYCNYQRCRKKVSSCGVHARAGRACELSYWRLASGIEVDFIVNDMELAIEAKSSARITVDHLRGMRAVVQDHPKLKRRIAVLANFSRINDSQLSQLVYCIEHLLVR